ARHMSEVNPGKCVSVPRLRLMQPFVTAEYFVCRFARQCHGRLIADRSEEQEQRIVGVAEARRQVTSCDYRSTDLRIRDGATFQDDAVMLGAHVPRHEFG